MNSNILQRLQLQPNQATEIAYNIVLAIVILLACAIISKIARSAVKKLNQKVDKFDATVIPILTACISYLVYTIGTVIILDIFGVNTASIVALLGTVGLAIGFALKDTLSNIAAGIMLLFLKPFRVDDSIEYGSVAGKVKEINLFTTILETADGIYVSSPNGSIWSSTIKNFTKNGRRRMIFSVGIGYNDSIAEGLKVLANLANNDSRILKDPAPQTVVVSLGDSSVNLELRCWASVSDYWPAYWEINQKMKEDIEGAGLSIPFPQRELHVIKPDALT